MLGSRPVRVALLALVVALPACGGKGGGGPGTPPPPGTDDPPTLNVLSPTGPVAEIPGGSFWLRLTANDDGAATVQGFLDVDGNLATTADQALVFSAGHQNGALQTKPVTVPPAFPTGTAQLIVEVDDGVNPAVVAPAIPVLVYPGLAGVAPARSNAYGVASGMVGFTVGEAESGGAILNGDGLADDGVVAFVDTSLGTVKQTTISADVSSVPPGGIPRILIPVQGSVAWNLREQDQGQSLTADVDLLDVLTVVINPSMTPIPTLIPPGGMTLVSTRSTQRFFALAKEPSASVDINLDGDQLDDVFFVVNPNGTAVPYNLDTPRANSPFVSAVTHDRAACLVDEAIQGTNNTPGIDLRGDGDTVDILLAILDHAGGRLMFAGTDPSLMPAQLPRNIDAAAAFAVSNQDFAGYYVDEGATQAGGGGPLNQDADTTDFVPAIYSIGSLQETMPGVGLNAGGAARFFFFDEQIALYTASEEGTVDRNGDGDMLDTEVLYWTDAVGAPTVANKVLPGVAGLQGLALDGGSAASIAPGWIGIAATEGANKDLNGDGDTLDTVYFIVNATGASPVVTNTGLVPLPGAALAGSTIPTTGVGGDDGVIVQAAETANGDLNSDGDNSDTLLFFFPFANPATRIALDSTGGFHVANVGGRIAVTAGEALTNQDFDGDGTALGFVLRVFDTTGTLLEPALPCPMVSRPTSETGSVWAYLRSESLEGVDFNKDGDLVDLVLGIWLN